MFLNLGLTPKIFLPLFPFLLLGCSLMGSDKNLPPMEVVTSVDLNRYIGTWHEIARYPNRFQKDCLSSTATYSFRDDGKIEVLNRCSSIKTPGKIKDARGKAWVVDQASNAKLKVQFFWPFSGDYWIIQLADDYSYVVVGHPKRKYIWIMARDQVIERDTYMKIIQRIVEQGYDPERLILSPAQTEYLDGDSST